MTADCAIAEKHPDGPGVISLNGTLSPLTFLFYSFFFVVFILSHFCWFSELQYN